MSLMLWGKLKDYEPMEPALNWALLVSVILIIWELANIKHTIQAITKEIFNLLSYYRYAWSEKAPKHPADLWHTLGANPSDSQILLPAAKLTNHNASFVYTGQPYFHIKAVDTITLQWNGTWRDYIKIRRLYRRFFKEYAIQTLTSHAEDAQYALEQRTLKVSHSVFGILFVSSFFKTLLGEKWFGNETLQVSFDKQLPDHDRNIGKELLKLCSSPASLSFLEEGKIEMVEIDYLDGGGKRSFRWVQDFRNKKLRLPVKRFISLPVDDSILQKETVLSLGGAEQNLALVYFVNRARWENPACTIGIAENAFDDYRMTKFQVGTESLVYGIKKELVGREVEDKNRASAEVFSFSVGGIHVISVYGYSAPMTKIAALKLLKNIVENNKQELPWYATEVRGILTYELPYQGSAFFTSEEIKEWDSLDVVNSGDWSFLDRHPLEVR